MAPQPRRPRHKTSTAAKASKLASDLLLSCRKMTFDTAFKQLNVNDFDGAIK
jgi:hypothetical protein